MKKILGWVIAMIVLGAVAYFGALLLGASHGNAAALATLAALAVGLAGSVFDAVAVFAAAFVVLALATLAALAVALAGIASYALGAVFATAFVSAFVTSELKVSFRRALAAYGVEAAAIFGMVYLSALWPPLLGIATLGGWLAAIHYRERRQRLATT